MELTIREGTRQDIPDTLQLIKELAHYEKAPNEVIVTEEELLRDGFSEHPLYQLKVAEKEGDIVGIALYYYGYSTWKGKMLYLDDLIVTRSLRRKGIGTQLFNALIKTAKANNAKQFRFHVLDWNEPAIQFYKKYKVRFESDWVTCKIENNQLKSDK